MGRLKTLCKLLSTSSGLLCNCEALNFAFPAVLAGGHDVMRLMLSAPRPSISWKDNALVTSRESGMSSQGQDEQCHLQLVDTHLLPNNICRYHGNILSPVLSVSAWVHDIQSQRTGRCALVQWPAPVQWDPD